MSNVQGIVGPALGGFIVALLTLGACGGPDASARGSDRPADRVISLVPSVTETILALGAGDRLVARTEYDTQAELAHLHSIGAGITPNIEAITRLDPDLVVIWAKLTPAAVSNRLSQLGIRTYTRDIRTIEDILGVVREMGDALGIPERADSLTRAIRAELDAVSGAVGDLHRPSVFVLLWDDPPMTTGPGTFIDEALGIAGGVNVFADAREPWPQVSLEELIVRDPDLIVVVQSRDAPIDIERLKQAPGWRELSAIRTGHVESIDPELLGRPGPAIGDATRRLAELLHPGRRTLPPPSPSTGRE